jgi:methionyl-tRNA formyltransferase
MGTPQLAATGLKALLESDFFDILAVITQKDKAFGRGLKRAKSATKILAEKEGLKIYQPEKLKDITEDIIRMKPELIVVIAYGKILPKEILEIPKFGCINVHGSLLPKYRGSSCIQGPILNGDQESGISIMKMDKGMDTGPIIKKIKINLSPEDDSLSLMNKIIKLTEDNLSPVIKDYVKGKLKECPQDESRASYVKMIKKEDGHIKPGEISAESLEKKVRAHRPWPGSYAFIEKDLPKTKLLFKILELNNNYLTTKDRLPGEIFMQEKKIFLQCKDKAIEILRAQLEGKRAMKANEIIQGNKWILNKVIK